jgi:hypothetical protein
MNSDGLMRFAAVEDVTGMLRRVMAMVGELEGLGAQMQVTVMVRVGDLMIKSNCSPTIAGMDMCEPGVSGMSSDGASTHLSTPGRSIGGSTLLGGSALPVTGSGQGGGDKRGGEGETRRQGEGDFLAGGGQGGIDWSGLMGTEAGAWVTSLEAGHVSWRKTPKELRQRLGGWVIQQLERPTQMVFDQVRPRWMPPASNMTLLFGMSWHDLVGVVMGPDW